MTTQGKIIQNQLAEDSEELLKSAILSNLDMTFEERISAHENARQLMLDLEEAGRAWRAAESKKST
ncbi:hypothetical protein WDW37_04100 [Bdellovibrionota bacterium FG-1]